VSVRLSLLTLLDQEPCYGYQLRTELDWRTGAQGPINVGQIYNTLDRLERDKLVRKTGENNYYEITPAGRAEVAAWLAAPSPSSDLAAKLALVATLPGVDVASVLRAQRAGARQVSDEGSSPATAQQLSAAIIAAAASIAALAEQDLLAEVEHLVKRGIGAVPLSSDIPKRGRPAKAAS
jgi:DNA-binding PadR family transcriptional regulator